MIKKEKYNVAVVGVGAVGVEILRCLESCKFPADEIRVFARSSREIDVDGKKYQVQAISEENFDGIDIALFAGTEGEKGAAVTYSKKFIEKGTVVIDNGADFRLQKDVPLVVPEANAEAIKENKGLISNPNCTTIQAMAALAQVYKQKGLKKMLLVSFQATSGAGRAAIQTLWDETACLAKNNEGVKDVKDVNKKLDSDFSVFKNQISFNAIPQIGGFADDDYTSEEWKVVHETHKIFNNDKIKISSTCVRIPVFTSHSEAIYFETEKESSVAELKEIFKNSPGVEFVDIPEYPLALDVEGKDAVYVGRLRRDPSSKNCFWIWCVADNLRKGAALNAVQIAQELIK